MIGRALTASRNRRAAAVALAAVFVALLLPALASAAIYQVNGTGDGSTQVACESGSGECTLRGAILASNSTQATKDRITFSGNPFNGQLGGTITTSAALPVLTESVEVDGGSCTTAAGPSGPCVAVKVPSGQLGLNVEASDTTIRGIAIGGGFEAIDVTESSAGFVAQNDWLGLALDGSAIGGKQAGIQLGPGSVGATIGGTAASQRNLFANYGTGLELGGASEVSVQGNWFGLKPDGTAATTAADFDISVHDNGASHASDNEIGAASEGSALASKACDGGCNVIANASTGIDLSFAGGPSGPTTIRGNYIGLGPDGTTVIANTNRGISAGAAADLTIGGPGGEADANFFAGGANGVNQGGGGGFELAGNRFGVGPVDGAATASVSNAVTVGGGPAGELPRVSENLISGGSPGIRSFGGGAELLDNTLTGAEVGVELNGAFSGAGNLVEGNEIHTPTGGNAKGIAIVNGPNQIFGNKIEGSCCLSGIFVSGTASGNQIGGDDAASENVINGFQNGAIAIVVPGTSHNEVGRNRGQNGESFIFAPSAIAAPAITGAVQSSISGSAEPGAKVRVFRKATEFAGEIEAFLGEAVADSSGNWKISFATVPVGTYVAATQTFEGGTSQLSGAPAVAADPVEPEEKTGGGGNSGTTPPAPPPPGPPAPAPAGTAPSIKISKGPAKNSSASTAKFKFTAAPAAGATFECKLDKGKYAKCKPPKTYKHLKPGKHSFQVKAVGTTGLKSKPATYKFSVQG